MKDYLIIGAWYEPDKYRKLKTIERRKKCFTTAPDTTTAIKIFKDRINSLYNTDTAEVWRIYENVYCKTDKGTGLD